MNNKTLLYHKDQFLKDTLNAEASEYSSALCYKEFLQYKRSKDFLMKR